MLVVNGDAELYRWDIGEWHLDSTVDAPTRVGSVEAGDVTDDGVTDFVVHLVGLDAAGGVYSREEFDFAAAAVQPDVGPDRLGVAPAGRPRAPRSDVVTDRGARVTVEWTWTGRQFEVLG